MTPVTTIGKVSNVWIRQMYFANVGDTEHGHKHPHDHVTLLTNGSLRVTVDGVPSVFSANAKPQMIFIKAEKHHELVALEANTSAFCIHGLRGLDDGDILDPAMVPDGVDATTLGITASLIS
jgi:quercetin dioxygenase-like cupin family protein